MATPNHIINLAPKHSFTALKQWPEAQLLMLVPRALWLRTLRYIPQFEHVRLAGRFGADPGDFEWEVLEKGQGLKWWRRTLAGDASYFGAYVTPNLKAPKLEVYGLIDIASDSSWWYDSVVDPGALQSRSEVVARQKRISMEKAAVLVSCEEYEQRGLLTTGPSKFEPAWRIGDREEVQLLRNALIALLDRARHATLIEEV